MTFRANYHHTHVERSKHTILKLVHPCLGMSDLKTHFKIYL